MGDSTLDTPATSAGLVPDAAIDLVYLDPPFHSNRDYKL